MRKVLVSLVSLVVAELPGKHYQEILDECEDSAAREFRREDDEKFECLRPLERKIGKGTEGDVFQDSDHRYVVKVSRSSRDPQCNSIAVMEVLDGLDGFAPRVYRDRSRCGPFRVLMDAVGEVSWMDEVRTVDSPLFYPRLVRLVQALKDLHSRGFVHFDIKGNNIRLNHQDDSVYLIDFGLAEPLHDWETGEELHITRADLRAVFKLLKGLDGEMPWLDAFWNDVMHSQPFPYDSWIQYFMKHAK